MATLIATVRRLTGAVSGDVADADVTAALDGYRLREVELPIVWERVAVSGVAVFKRGRVDAWGLLEPTTQATATTNSVTVALLDGTAASGNWTLDQDGTIVFASDQAAATDLYVSAYGYDVNAACADVVDQLVGLCAGDYDVKLGDQTFSRSQGAERLRGLAAGFRRKMLPAPRAMQMLRADEVPSPVRVKRRAGWR